MKLIEALQLAGEPAPQNAEPLSLALACGFTPDQFSTLLVGHIRKAKPKRTVAVSVGLFGDLAGNLERLAASRGAPDAIAVPVEWADLDDRLGLRSLGGWLPEAVDDIICTAKARLDRMEAAVHRLASASLVALSFPTLPLPPISFRPPGQAGSLQIGLRAAITEAATRLGAIDGVRIAETQAIDRASNPCGRHDVRSELTFGYPYHAAHASALAGIFARLIDPPAPKKGLITDLDDTLWKGLVGEIGADAVAWDLDAHAQMHGVYQQILSSLAASGVLLAVASKNDSGPVEQAFKRKDLHVKAERFFPMEVSWGPESTAVTRILKAWNVGPDSIVFVDDSQLELAEVKSAHPEAECLRFPRGDDAAAYALIERLREFFGKPALSGEDAYRLESLRRGAEVREGLEIADPSAFLATLEAVIEITDVRDPLNRRPLELINKTNQFNLNGRRLTEAAWLANLAHTGCFTLAIGYRDKFGPLGTIAVVAGRRTGKSLTISHWVMSCRAFSRAIEHRVLSELLERFGAEEINLDYEPTNKNGPIQEFLRGYIAADQELAPGLRLSREKIKVAGPHTYHQVKERVHHDVDA